MLLREYDEEAHIKKEKEWSREEGIAEGQKRITSLYQRLLEEERMEDMQKALKDNAYQKQLLKEYGL